MHKALVSLAALAVLFTPQVALADEAIGTLEAVDADSGIIFLTDGQQFIAPDEMNIEDLPDGAEIRIVFEVNGEDNFATDVEIVQ